MAQSRPSRVQGQNNRKKLGGVWANRAEVQRCPLNLSTLASLNSLCSPLCFAKKVIIC